MSRTNKSTRTPTSQPASSPTVLTSFVGRRHEIGEVERLVTGPSRLVTLTGAAGCGKTRLALRVATDISHVYVDGVHWVDFARLSDPELVPQIVAKALHVTAQHGRSLDDALLGALHDKQLLLVLDNCEHVLSASSQLVDTLLAGTEISILATSREPFGLAGEMRYPVPPMALPPLTVSADVVVVQFDAIQLFVERARAILPDFVLTPGNADMVSGICRHLDGIPLAIELAGARVNVLTVEQIAARLDDRFRLLEPAPHVTHSHHRTLRAALDWSYDLLSMSEQIMFQRLSVFAGGCSLATLEAVCAGEGLEPEQMLELLSSLVNKSLVVAQTLRRGEARYSLHETVRQYAKEKLLASGGGSRTNDRLLQSLLHLVEETVPKLGGAYQQLWLDWLEDEYDNIRAALTWSLESKSTEAGLRIAIAVYQFWTIRDYVQEGLAWLERLLAQADESVSSVVRANGLAYASFLAGFRGNNTAQMAYGREAAALAEAAGHEGKPALKWALSALAHGARAAGDYRTEFALGTRVIQLNRELDDSYQLGVTLSVYSPTATALGLYHEANAMLDESLVLLRQAGNPYRIAMALNYLGDLARCEHHYTQAQVAYEESISLLRELSAVRDLASVLHNLGHTYLHLGDFGRAKTLINESMALHRAQGNRQGMAECLIGFAALAVSGGLPAACVRLLAATVALGGQHIATAWPATRMEYEHYLSLARADLPETEVQAEQSVGRMFSLQRAVEYAQELPLKSAAGKATEEEAGGLTAREREVAALIGLGKSNGAIADELVVSKRTVEKHIANILSKLGFSNRAQIVRWATESELVRSTE